jgi:hypothetical protein
MDEQGGMETEYAPEVGNTGSGDRQVQVPGGEPQTEAKGGEGVEGREANRKVLAMYSDKCTIFASSLSFDVDEKDLQSLFGDAGRKLKQVRTQPRLAVYLSAG